MSKGNFGGGYGAVREYRDDPDQSGHTDSRYQNTGSEKLNGYLEQVSTNIYTINNGANSLDRAMKLIGTNRDSVQLRDKIHDTSKNTHETVNTTMKLFKSITNIRTVDKAQRLKTERLRNDFQESVQRFTALQKKAAQKVKTSVSLGSTQKPQATDSTGWLDDNDQQKLIQIEEQEARQQQLQTEGHVLEEDLALVREREERIRQLEADILDVNEIFRDLGTMIHEQGEVLDTIEANVTKTSGNVEEGAHQLMKGAEYQKKSRKKLLCLLLILFIVAAVVTLIIVLTVN